MPFFGETKSLSAVVYNLEGERVRMLMSGVVEKGDYDVVWHGLNSSGQRASGICLSFVCCR
jgi:hypothetical protein